MRIPFEAYSKLFTVSDNCGLTEWDLSLEAKVKPNLALDERAIYLDNTNSIVMNSKLLKMNKYEQFYISGSSDGGVPGFKLVTLTLKLTQQELESKLGISLDSMGKEEEEEKKKSSTGLELATFRFGYKVKKVDSKGILVMKFNKEIEEIDLAKINDEALELVGINSTNTQETFEVKWKPVKLHRDRLEIQVQFDNPLMISQGFVDSGKYDRVQVNILDPFLFRGISFGEGIGFVENNVSTTFSQGPIMRQFGNDAISQYIKQNSQEIGNSIKNIVLANTIITFIVALGLSLFLSMLHVVQVVIFQFMINVVYPANALYFAKLFSEILNIDIIEP
jgi:hypothetical protein